MVRDADLIVVMGVRHRDTVAVLDTDALDYTFLLTNFSDRIDGDSPDPIGGDRELYLHTFDAIRECVESMAGKLERFDGWKRVRGGTS
jgi:protein-tyrosine-phosphatase